MFPIRSLRIIQALAAFALFIATDIATSAAILNRHYSSPTILRRPSYLAFHPRSIHFGIAPGIPTWFERAPAHDMRPDNSAGAHTTSEAFASLLSVPSGINLVEDDFTVFPTYTFSGYPTITIDGPNLQMSTSCLYVFTQYRGTATPAFVVFNQCTETTQSFLINGSFESNYTSYLNPGGNIITSDLYMHPYLEVSGTTSEVLLYNWTNGAKDVIATYSSSKSPSGLITGSQTLEENHGSTTVTCSTLPTFSIDEVFYQAPTVAADFTPSTAEFSYSGPCFTPGHTSPYDSYVVLSYVPGGNTLPEYGYEVIAH